MPAREYYVSMVAKLCWVIRSPAKSLGLELFDKKPVAPAARYVWIASKLSFAEQMKMRPSKPRARSFDVTSVPRTLRPLLN